MPDAESDQHNFWRDQWALRPGVTYLNHGSFGPSPRVVMAARQEWIERLESEPIDFFVRQLEGHLENVRHRLGEVVGTSGDNLLLVDNATFGMNIVADSFPLAPGDEVLATNHEYGAVLRIWREACRKAGAKLVVQKLPEMFESDDEVVETFFRGASDRTKLIVVSHITSPTALVLPVEDICRRAKERGIRICIDGPHALAAVPVEIDRLACDFYCASCHKWLSAPFGSGFLYVYPRWQQSVRPVVTSWGDSLSGRQRTWQDEFVWSGTRDPSPFLAIPAAIEFFAGSRGGPEPYEVVESIFSSEPGPNEGGDETNDQFSEPGWERRLPWKQSGARELIGIEYFRAVSESLVHVVRDRITDLTGLEPIGEDFAGWYRTMITLPLPDSVGETPQGHIHPLQAALWERFQIEVPIVNWNGRRHIRVSCHLYNDGADIDRLVAALGELL